METYENILNNARLVVKSIFAKIQEYPHFEEIQKRAKKAEEKIDYHFSDISYLPVIFCRTKIPPGKNNYMNETLAQLGDFVLDLVIAELYFSQGKGKAEIDRARQNTARNSCLINFTNTKELVQFCYNEQHFHDEPNVPDHEKVSANQHDSFVEALIGAIYLDGGLNEARKWIYENIIKNIIN